MNEMLKLINEYFLWFLSLPAMQKILSYTSASADKSVFCTVPLNMNHPVDQNQDFLAAFIHGGIVLQSKQGYHRNTFWGIITDFGFP